MLSDATPVIREWNSEGHQKKLVALRDAINSGAYPATAASYAGIAPATLAGWVKQGVKLIRMRDSANQDPDDHRRPAAWEGQLIEIAELVLQGEAQVEVKMTQRLYQAAVDEDDLDTLKWFMARRYPGWAAKSEVKSLVELAGDDDGVTTPELLAQVRKRILGAEDHQDQDGPMIVDAELVEEEEETEEVAG